MAGRNPRNPTTTREGRAPVRMRVATSVLEHLKADEAAAVLKILLERHQNVREEAEQIATDLVSFPSLDEVAGDVLAAVTLIGSDAVKARAGRTSWGYLGPTEAAWESLEEALEDVISDMKRRMELGLTDAAETMCRGIVIGLHRARTTKKDGALLWAPDFPAEEACQALAELLRACPPDKRKNIRNNLLEALTADVPDWSAMLERVAKRAMSGK